jgi:predicted porin
MSFVKYMAASRLRAVVVTCAALGAVTAVSAQSVTIYGRIDVGLQIQDKNLVNDSTHATLHTGGLRPSIWGFKGVEDLGGGLKAEFNLEGQFDSSTGAQMNLPGSGGIFRRQANVGLSGDWGSLQFGRLYSPLIWGTIGVEPRAWKEQFSQLGQLVYNSLSSPQNSFGAGTNNSNDVGSFIGNALLYSNHFGPFYIGVGYALGEQAGDSSNGTQLAIGASYTGPVTVGFGYHNVKDSNSGVTIHDLYDIGIAIPMGDFTTRVNYFNAENKDPVGGAKVSDIDSYGVGVDYRWSEKNTATAVYYHNNYDGGGASSTTKAIVLSNDYAISKRTTLYAQYAYEDSDGLVNPGDALEYLKRTIVIGASAPPGKKTSLISLGIMHHF